MDVNQGLDTLSNLFKGRDWFYDVGMDNYGRFVVYVKYMNDETLHDIPDMVANRQVLVHFAASKTARADQFSNQDDHQPFPLVTKTVDVTREAEMVEDGLEVVELPSSLLEYDVSDLCKELDRLEKMCGSNCLQDIFYEVHDGKNAVTNLSVKYPDVRSALERLYNEYGFDVIYEELDG